MIVKKQEKNGKIKAMYSSSTICGSIYDTETKDLTVIFNNGGQYQYPNVEASDYTRFEIAESNGSVFNTYIKKKYTNFTKLTPLTESALNSVLEEVKTLKAAEDSASLELKTKEMLTSMSTLISTYLSTGNISQDIIEKVKTKIEAYEGITLTNLNTEKN